ncbi:hypothetical protein Val02_62740 [Virgisporangium aliadipatigenens]|uniref:Uncharacterized protein n=1 Tax=Virgisporangium aliadipatigenens TaxID=741659 RepID=A0A8J3YTC1_9ACTN|nr:hypothetical protein [Virgisporangium aliadipatigenens]GIJ49388.1 hypothetical protein Val02_62740 [Virgisporangium aliadipatigenens]
MPTFTISDVLHAVRRLETASSGRLIGIDLADTWRRPTVSRGVTGWPAKFAALVAMADDGTICGETPKYAVFSDQFPVCWITHDGVIVTPDGTALSPMQVRHQRQAIEALRDLARYAIGRLADLHAARNGRPDDVDNGHWADRAGVIRVADPSVPARAWWVPIDADRDEAHRRVREATGVDEPLILTAYGYGAYGRASHRLHLDVLCALNTAADRHDVPAAVVGDWLSSEAGFAASAAEIVYQFAQAYVGTFDHERHYTAVRLAESGWEQALRDLGAFEFFDTDKFNRHLFTYDVRAIANPTGMRGIIVCRRRSQ